MMVKVKICGITRPRDAMLAAAAGADALGFNFWPGSSRYVEPERVRAICLTLPPFVAAVGVFVDEDVDRLRELAEFCRLDVVQLHGHETPRIVSLLKGLRIIKATRVATERHLRDLERYTGVSAFLLDTYVRGVPGGTGKTFDWSLARQAAAHRKIILAGGLTPDNVDRAIHAARPYAVDVAGGVEGDTPGIKDRKLLERFIRAAKSVQL